MIRVMLRIPLEHSFLIIKVKASSPVKIMQSLESMVKAMNNDIVSEYWDKNFKLTEKTFIGSEQETIMVEQIQKTIMKGKETLAAVDMDDRYNYLNKTGQPYTCNTCHGLISWDKYPDVKHPIHVNEQGKIIGDGSCPDFG
jgi:hypothetical protein